MQIELSTAQEVVTEIKSVIDQDINFFNEDSTIIASTDLKRIGEQNHGGASKSMKNNALVIIEYDEQYNNSRKGINLPIEINNNVIGAIGVTGEYEEVIKYAEIVKKMTEILVRENISKELLFNRGNTYRYIIDCISNEGPDNQAITQIKALYDFNFNEERIALVASSTSGDFQSASQSNMFQELFYMLNDNNNCIFNIQGNNIVIFVSKKSIQTIHMLCDQINRVFKNKFNMNVIFGAGSWQSGISNYKKSLTQAQVALNYNINNDKVLISYYEELSFEPLLMELSRSSCHNFLEHIFGNIDEDEFSNIVELINVYTEANGSINEISEKLYIHKNTVQYRLKKIKKITGYDLRVYADYFILKLAAEIIRLK